MGRRYLRLILLPLCPVWALVTQLRNELYRAGVVRRREFPLPTFVAGNLSAGGTGKSPHTEFLARKLSRAGIKTAILSRGYGRRSLGFILSDDTSTAATIGDEPMMMKRSLKGVDIAVAEDRAFGIEKLIEKISPEAIVMDDAYQHLKVRASCYFLLTTFARPFTSDYLLPAGDLREMRMNAERAHCVIVTKTPEQYTGSTPEAIAGRERYRHAIKRYTSAPVIFSTYSYSPRVISCSGDEIKSEELKKYGLLLVTGVADPTQFLEHIGSLGASFRHLNFPDHHFFSLKDAQKIESALHDMPEDKKNIILTTEKDLVRLQGILPAHLPLYSMPIEVRMSEEDEAVFDSVVSSALEKYNLKI